MTSLEQTSPTGQPIKLPSLKYLVDNEHFIVCSFQSTDWFVKYCKERGIETSREQLEQLEKAGYLYPIARAQHQQNYFWYRTDHARLLLDEGLLWEPSTRLFQPWETFKDKSNQKQIESFYSIFQVYPLYDLLDAIGRFQIRPEKLISLKQEEMNDLYEKIQRNKEWILSDRRERNLTNLATAICQVISNRYYPRTQTDRRTIIVTSAHFIGKWEWEEYCLHWNAQAVLADIGIDLKTLKRLCYKLEVDSKKVDPMEKWRELVRFISVDKKQKLKSDAQLALTLYSMHEMLNMFHEDLTGERVFLSGKDPEDKDYYYGEGVSQNPLEYLSYLVNEFHLNPKPSLILVVEGEGEYKALPRLAKELFGITFPEAGIEIRNLKGVGGFTGHQVRDKYGALEKYIDHNHDRQTYVIVILDNEGGTKTVKDRLVGKRSDLFPQRMVTRDEFIHIWNYSIEVDNFDFDDIAQALTEFCQHDYEFTSDDVEAGYASNRGNPLEALVSQKTKGKYSLNKVELLNILCGYIISSTEDAFDNKWKQKPIFKLLDMVITLGTMNHQPIDQDAWRENQLSGFFGHVTGEKETYAKEYLERIKENL